MCWNAVKDFSHRIHRNPRIYKNSSKNLDPEEVIKNVQIVQKVRLAKCLKKWKKVNGSLPHL